MLSAIRDLLNKTKAKLYFIELDDEKLNREMTHIIHHMEYEIQEFKKTINETTLTVKDEILLHFFEEMTKLRNDISTIKKDVNRIVGMKLENLKYFIIKDDSYLLDKKRDLEEMETAIAAFLQIVEQRPSSKALQKHLLSDMNVHLEKLQKLISRIIADDINLQTIYKKMHEA